MGGGQKQALPASSQEMVLTPPGIELEGQPLPRMLQEMR